MKGVIALVIALVAGFVSAHATNDNFLWVCLIVWPMSAFAGALLAHHENALQER